MSAVIIPWQNAIAFQQQVTLDGRLYSLRLRFNGESGHWSMDISDRNREPLVTGIRLAKGQALLYACRAIGLPRGDFFVIGNGMPTRENMGDGLQLIYLELPDDAV